MSATRLAKGLLTWIPGVQRAFFDRTAAGGTASAAYCYGVWIKHLALLWAHGMDAMPRTVLELGPGASIGTGVAALLSGAERYIGIDALPHMRPESNAVVFRELVQLFRERAPRPTAGFPPFDQFLDERMFPSQALDDARLVAALDPARLARIERAVRTLGTEDSDGSIRYHTWDSRQPIADDEVDLAFSHVVINQIDDLESLYANCARWMRPGGWMSHQVDFTSLGTADEWNGHRAYGEFAWKIISGKRPYFVNREPLATHLQLLDRHGFEIVEMIRGRMAGGIGRSELAPRWRGISDDDLSTQTGFIIAQRRAH